MPNLTTRPLPLGIHRLGASIFLAGLAACVNPLPNADPLQIIDERAFSPRLRVAYPLEECEKENSRTWLGAELAVHSGDFEDAIPNGQEIRIGETALNGPGLLHGDYDLRRASFYLQGRAKSSKRFRYSGFLGLSFTDLDLDVRLNGVSDTDRRLVVGPMVGGEVETSLATDLNGFLRLLWHFGVSHSDPVTQVMLETGMTWKLNETLGLTLGYHLTDFQLESKSNQFSDLDLEIEGAFLSLDWSLGH